MNLNEKFSQNIFLDWIDELLPDFERDVKRVDVPKSFTEVSKIESLGKSPIGVMVFAIQMDSDPTRRRVSITKDSFNLLKNYSVQNAIIAYFCPSFGQWRLSLLTSTATWEDGRVISKLSNLKRQSFVLGVNAKTKTPTKYLAGKVADLTDLKKRFSIEVVNKDFYKEISSAFNSLQSVLQLPSKEAKSQTNLEFSVRLIGRIIFCWFLREKRSEAEISLISDKVLSLDAVKNTKDYYHKLLEPLFFEVLNKPLESRNFDEFDKEPFTQTPYLNGGLFSAQYDDYYERSRNDFQSKYHNTLVVPNSWFESLFETLETYHFTIDENTSYDEELSIDPEMLGRIFENLLAEINPETGESARKSTGSYYTPRVIVDYMVDESLTLYLKNKTNIDEEKIRAVISYDLDDDQSKPLTQTEKENIIDALGKLKILDPACGSGAFPMGALQKIVFILQQIDPNAEVMHAMDLKQTPPEFRRHIQEEFSAGNYDYLRKLRVIRESIYGVDIQPIATEISRLRCFLTLVVDQAIKDDKSDRGIKPLPNLDFKFVTANTLIGLPKNENGVQQMGIYDNREKIERLKEIIDDYFNSSGIEREQLKAKFAQEQKSLLREMEQEHGWSNIEKAELSNKLIDWEPFSHKAADWFDQEWMFGVKEGFDVVIANPPYIFARNSAHKGLSIRDKQYFYDNYKLAKYQVNLYALFIELSTKILKNGGCLSFITPNNWLTINTNKELRKFILEKSNITIINFYSKVFESASVDSSVVIFENDNKQPVVNLYEYTDRLYFIKTETSKHFLDKKEMVINIESIKNPDISIIIDKIEKCSVEINKIADVKAGLKAYEVGKGNPPQTKQMKDKRVYHSYEKLDDSYYRYLEGKNVSRYSLTWGGEYLKYGPNLAAPRGNFALFSTDRILVRQIPNKPPYCIHGCNTSEIYLNDLNSMNIINIKENSDFILGVINSRLISFWFIHKFGKLQRGTFPQFKINELELFPITKERNDSVNKIIDLVNLIKAIKIKDPFAEISTLDKQIDYLVYQLYGISPAEIELIEQIN